MIPLLALLSATLVAQEPRLSPLPRTPDQSPPRYVEPGPDLIPSSLEPSPSRGRAEEYPSDAFYQPPQEPRVERRLSAQPGETLWLNLEGEGWILVSPPAGLPLPIRERAPSGVRFRLQAREEGDFRLVFQRQDPLRGSVVDQTVLLSVRSPRPVQPLVPSVDPSTGEDPLERAETLLRLGRLSEAREVLQRTTSGGQRRWVLLARVNAGLMRGSEAVDSYTRALEGEFDGELLAEALVAASRFRRPTALLDFWRRMEERYLSSSRPPLGEASYFEVVDALGEAFPDLLGQALERWETWYPLGSRRDEWLWRRARWAEEVRDFAEAARLYTWLVRDHPLSEHSRGASLRLADLRSRLFQIR